jgi:hypothetical protein
MHADCRKKAIRGGVPDTLTQPHRPNPAELGELAQWLASAGGRAV